MIKIYFCVVIINFISIGYLCVKNPLAWFISFLSLLFLMLRSGDVLEEIEEQEKRERDKEKERE